MHIENTEIYLLDIDYYENGFKSNSYIVYHILISHIYLKLDIHRYWKCHFLFCKMFISLANYKDAIDYITNERKSTETKKVVLIEPR